MSIEITQEEWLAEMSRLLVAQHDDGGLTIAEWMEATQQPYAKVQKMIKRGVKAGKIAVGKRRIEKDWDGRARIYTVYRPAGDDA